MKLKHEVVYAIFPTTKKSLYTTNYESENSFNVLYFAFIREEHLPNILTIKAVKNSTEIDVPLVLMPKHFYRAEVEGIGIFYFSVDNTKDVFVEENGDKLSLLTPINEDFFESACRNHRFFFIGNEG